MSELIKNVPSGQKKPASAPAPQTNNTNVPPMAKATVAQPAPSATAPSSSSGSDPAARRTEMPSAATAINAMQIAITEDKPILLDYWVSSVEKKSLIGIRDTGEKLLVKSDEEYTSPISKFYKVGNEFIVLTENSIYIVSADIPKRKIA